MTFCMQLSQIISCYVLIRTIKYIEGAIETKVVGLVLFPCVSKYANVINSISTRTLSNEEIQAKISALEYEFGMKIYSANSTEISKDIIELFS